MTVLTSIYSDKVVNLNIYWQSFSFEYIMTVLTWIYTDKVINLIIYWETY